MAAVTLMETMEIRMTRLASDVGHVQSDLTELKADVRGLRKEVGEIRADIGTLGKELTKGLLTTRIWMLLMCAAILGVIARGFHWL